MAVEIDQGLLWTPPSDTPRDSIVPSGSASEPSCPVSHRDNHPAASQTESDPQVHHMVSVGMPPMLAICARSGAICD